MTMHLELTEVNHADNEFYSFGPINLEVDAMRAFDRLPTDPPHVCDEHDVCWMIDLCDESGSIHDNREVSEETARQLVPNFEARSQQARAGVDALYAMLGESR